MTVPAELIDLIGQSLWLTAIVFFRVGAAMFVLPALGETQIPTRVRLAIAIALSVLLTPLLASELPRQGPEIFDLLVLIGTETVAGLSFGLLLRFFVHALQVAGTIAAQSTSLSQIFGGSATVDPQPAMGHVLWVGGIALAMVLGVHEAVVHYLVHSYQLVPAGHLLSADTLRQIGVSQVSRCFSLGFQLAGPFLVASVLYNVTLGVINRAMPQLMVSFVGAPAITAGGLILLALSAPLMLSVWHEALMGFVIAPGRVP